jgi:hypothetical protein
MRGLLLLLGVGAAIYTFLVIPMMRYRAARQATPSLAKLSPIIQSPSA